MKIKTLILLFLTMLSVTAAVAQTAHPFDMHGIRPGMITREIILYSHAPLDTLEWGGATGASLIGFHGVYLDDTGTFRVNVNGKDIERVTFIAPTRTAAENGAAFHRAMQALTKLLGKPADEYHNVYRIVTWNSGDEQCTLTTTDGGRFYTVALAFPHPISIPGPNPNVVPNKISH